MFLSSSGKVSDHCKCLYRKRTCFLLENEVLLREMGLFSWRIWFFFQSQEQYNNLSYCSGRKYTCIISILAVNTILSHQASLLVSMHWVSLYCLVGRFQLLFVILQAHISPFTAQVKILKLSFDCQSFSMH